MLTTEVSLMRKMTLAAIDGIETLKGFLYYHRVVARKADRKDGKTGIVVLCRYSSYRALFDMHKRWLFNK